MDALSQNGMMTSAFAQMFNDDDFADKVQNFFGGAVGQELENDANALGPEVGAPEKVGEEAAVGGAKLLDEADQLVTKYWPENGGFLGEATETTLSPGTLIDRYGFEKGAYTSPIGTPFEMRGLPESSRSDPYNAYEVLRPIEGVKTGITAPWFGQPGMGIQHVLPDTVKNLVEQGYLRRLS